MNRSFTRWARSGASSGMSFSSLRVAIGGAPVRGSAGITFAMLFRSVEYPWWGGIEPP